MQPTANRPALLCSSMESQVEHFSQIRTLPVSVKVAFAEF